MTAEPEIEFHPCANIFPLLEGVAFRELVEDVRVHGLRESILLYEGQILDGRNRYRACRAAQVAARFKTYGGKDPIAFVVSANLHRRHLDASQRAMIAAEIVAGRKGKPGRPRKSGWRDSKGWPRPAPKNLKHGNVKGRFDQAAATQPNSMLVAGKLLNVSEPAVRAAQQVIRRGSPELIAAVKSGAASVFSAKEVARLPKDQQAKILKSDPRKVTVIGRIAHRERLDQRRNRRAADAGSEVAVFDHLKIGDGRSIGSIRLGEIDRLVSSLRMAANILDAVKRRFAHGDHSARVRDLVNAGTLSQIIADVRASTADDVVA